VLTIHGLIVAGQIWIAVSLGCHKNRYIRWAKTDMIFVDSKGKRYVRSKLVGLGVVVLG
jgi:hypothetical protein